MYILILVFFKLMTGGANRIIFYSDSIMFHNFGALELNCVLSQTSSAIWNMEMMLFQLKVLLSNVLIVPTQSV